MGELPGARGGVRLSGGPGDRTFVRWAKRYVPEDDARRILGAYKKANLIAVDNRNGTFRVLDLSAVSREALEAAAENLRPSKPPKKRWNQLSDEERQRLINQKRSIPEQWEKQERVELAIAKLNSR
jgi:hypothetical protein